MIYNKFVEHSIERLEAARSSDMLFSEIFLEHEIAFIVKRFGVWKIFSRIFKQWLS
jgi:hypothetical protein